MGSDRPNILMLMGDQHPVFMAGCSGHDLALTPAMDGIAERGVTFETAYCPNPLCAPTRASMMAGRYVSAIEVWDNRRVGSAIRRRYLIPESDTAPDPVEGSGDSTVNQSSSGSQPPFRPDRVRS